MNVRFCRSCRSLILTDFLYCPYCGERTPRGPDLKEALNDPFSRLESAEGGGETRPSDRPGALAEPAARDKPAPGASGERGAGNPSRQAVIAFAAAEASLARLEADMDFILAEIGKGAD